MDTTKSVVSRIESGQHRGIIARQRSLVLAFLFVVLAAAVPRPAPGTDDRLATGPPATSGAR